MTGRHFSLGNFNFMANIERRATQMRRSNFGGLDDTNLLSSSIRA